MATQFRADNIGSLLRPAELLEARAALREGRMDERQVREIEDRSILKALEMQKGAGVQMSSPTASIAGIFLPRISPRRWTGSCPASRWSSSNGAAKVKELAEESKEGNLQYIVGGKLTEKGPLHAQRSAVFETACAGAVQGVHAGGDAACDHALSARRVG